MLSEPLEVKRTVISLNTKIKASGSIPKFVFKVHNNITSPHLTYSINASINESNFLESF